MPTAIATVATASGCSAAAGQGPGAAPSATVAQSLPAVTSSAAANSPAALVVPAGVGGGALSVPRTLTVPVGWTARVWARVPDAR